MRLSPFPLLLLLAGCQQPQTISSGPLLGSLPGVQQGLVDASYNLNSAIAIGVLPAGDPAAACVNGVLTSIGIDPSTGKSTGSVGSFTPREGDLLALGSVGYILAQQALPLVNGGVPVPVGCEALIGKLVIDAAGLVNRFGGTAVGLPTLPIPLRNPDTSIQAPLAPSSAPQRVLSKSPVKLSDGGPTVLASTLKLSVQCDPLCH